MLSKRLNIMLYSPLDGEQIVLPVNPERIEIKYGKKIEKFEILGFGEINIPTNPLPLEIRLSHFLPEDGSPFAQNSRISLGSGIFNSFIECEYSQSKAVEILKRWAVEKTRIRLIIDEELNIECILSSFKETLRENTPIKPYELVLVEYKNPTVKVRGLFGLATRAIGQYVPNIILAKAGSTIYSIASKYKLDWKKLKELNAIKNVNQKLNGIKVFLKGRLK